MSLANKDNILSFPNPFASENDKKNKEYGLAYARAIWADYQKNLTFYRQDRDILNRKYAEGLQSVDKYKDRLGLNGDLSYLNLDFNPVPIIPKYVDNIVGRLKNELYKIQCKAIDPSSAVKEDGYRRKMLTNMLLKTSGLGQELEERTGVPLLPKNEAIPESIEEAELYMQLNYKQAECIAMEQALEYILYNNDWSKIQDKVLRDLVVLKKAAIYRYYDKDYNIRLDWADFVDLVYPYSKYDDFKNIPYVGIRRQYTIDQIASMTNEFTEQELYDIAKQYSGQNGNLSWNASWQPYSYEGYYNNNQYIGRPYGDFNISILEFYFKTPDKVRYVKKTNEKGKIYFEKKDKEIKGSKSKIDIIDKYISYRYEGKWIIGSDKIFDYKKSENIEREKDNDGSYKPECELPIVMIAPEIYDMQNKSLVERMIPHADQITLIHLKSQQLLIKAKPPGVAFDLEGLDNIIDGMGKGLSGTDIAKMYEQTGNALFRSRDAAGNIINSNVIQPLDNGMSSQFNQLINAYQHEVNMINDIIGYNSAVDGSTPDAKALVGVQKLAAVSANNNLKPLFNAYIWLVEKTAKRLTLMIQDVCEHGDGMKFYSRAIGNQAVKTIAIGKEIALNQFGIEIEFLPTEEDKADLIAMINIALQSGTIKTSDAVLIKQIMKSNVKLAAQMLILRENKNIQEKQTEVQNNNMAMANANAQTAQATAIANAQAEAQIMQQKAFLLETEYKLKGGLSDQEHKQRMMEIQLQNSGKVKVAETQHEGSLLNSAFNNSFNQQQTTAR